VSPRATRRSVSRIAPSAGRRTLYRAASDKLTGAVGVMCAPQIDVRAAPLTEGTFSYVNWGAIVAGTVAAAALELVLHSFAARKRSLHA